MKPLSWASAPKGRQSAADAMKDPGTYGKVAGAFFMPAPGLLGGLSG